MAQPSPSNGPHGLRGPLIVAFVAAVGPWALGQGYPAIYLGARSIARTNKSAMNSSESAGIRVTQSECPRLLKPWQALFEPRLVKAVLGHELTVCWKKLRR